MKRRTFVKSAAATIAVAPLTGISATSAFAKKAPYKISLAQWSLHRALKGGKMTNLDFPIVTKKEFGIYGLEYVNQFFKDKAKDNAYLTELLNITKGEGMDNVLIMIDGEGGLGVKDDKKKTQAIENHYKWVEAARFLGCHSIRVNARTDIKDFKASQAAAIDGLGRLSEFAKDFKINVIVENHGGLSSNGKWLSEVLAGVDMKNCGALPDFGNFCITRGQDADGNRICKEEYDRYKGTEELMPFAKGVSAKSHVFDSDGNEVNTDYVKMLKIVKASGYKGYIGVEYEGSDVSEYEGIKLTKALLEKAMTQI